MAQQKFAFFLCSIFICVGCRSLMPHQKVLLDKDSVITLGRTACFGNCPVYTVTINGLGEVVLNGSKMSRAGGNFSGQPLPTKNASISQEQLQQLSAEFERINYLALDDTYDNNRKSVCPAYGTDSPHAITSITINGAKKSVQHDLGCSGTATLKDLTSLEEKIDEIAGAKEWLK